MQHNLKLRALTRWGGLSLLAAVAIQTSFVALVPLPELRGPAITTFLSYFLIAAVAYGIAVARLGRDRLSIRAIWAFAILFRLTLLLISPPELSDDVYRYLWDGRLVNAGINPYAYAVESPLLDAFDSPQRALINHSWMASPYLPTAQALFTTVYWLAADSPLAFQVAAVLFDLLTGWLVMDMLGRLGLPRKRALIYLWNPLVVVEFAHSAHADALMVFLAVTALWFLVAARPRGIVSLVRRQRRARWFILGSVIALAAATLTKGLPALLLPVMVRRWGWRLTLVYAGLIVAIIFPFALGAGWGLAGPLDGRGLFGAIRIYTTYWNFNAGLYHWLEVGLSGHRTPGAVPPEVVGWAPIQAAKLIVGGSLGLLLLVVWWTTHRLQTPPSLIGKGAGGLGNPTALGHLTHLRLALIPLAAYLLLATTLHPWYVTLIVPLLPFLLPERGEATTSGRFLWPWLYFSAAVSLSYLTYVDPANLREYQLVRLVEYVPFYLLLLWSARPATVSAEGFIKLLDRARISYSGAGKT